jgi:glyoxylase-like metal-dependent hydrolase (beta-lactamase superfamily II)
MARVIRVGSAELTVINIGDLMFAMKEVISAPESEWRQRYGDLFEKRRSYPSQSILVSMGGSSILVDAGEYWKFATEGTEYVEEGYKPPPDLVSQLSALNVKAEDISRVVITHAHYDHFAGVTTEKGGRTTVTFPNALHYLGKADWEWEELQKSLADSSSNESKSLGVLHGAGILELVSQEKELIPGVTILPSPGESPGHQILRVRSEGQAAYCVGDLFHDVAEVENPAWMASWCDPPSNLRSRRTLLASALREDAMVIPGHMKPGHVREIEGGMTFVEG